MENVLCGMCVENVVCVWTKCDVCGECVCGESVCEVGDMYVKCGECVRRVCYVPCVWRTWYVC